MGGHTRLLQRRDAHSFLTSSPQHSIMLMKRLPQPCGLYVKNASYHGLPHSTSSVPLGTLKGTFPRSLGVSTVVEVRVLSTASLQRPVSSFLGGKKQSGRSHRAEAF
ncbi:uncharacterized protein LOC132693334 [Panthera onca]